MKLDLQFITGHVILHRMNLRSAAFLALIGTLVLTILAAADFIHTLSAVLGNLLPAVAVLRASIYLFAAICWSVFFWVFYRRQ